MRAAYNPPESNTREALHLTLWGAQVVLAMLFGLAGFLTLANPLGDLEQVASWMSMGPELLPRIVGAVMLLCAIALILPAASRRLTVLTPLAAAILAGFSVVVGFVHLIQGQPVALPVDLFLAAMAFFVAWGRLIPCPIPEAGPRHRMADPEPTPI